MRVVTFLRHDGESSVSRPREEPAMNAIEKVLYTAKTHTTGGATPHGTAGRTPGAGNA